MISVVGKSEQDARSALSGIGVEVSSVSSDYSDTVPEGCVISQSISEGTYVNPGTGVTLTISLGKKVVDKYYSLVNYTIDSSKLSIPDGATDVKIDVTLYTSNNEKVKDWTGQSLPFTANASDIKNCSDGYFIVKCSWTVTDESGNPKQETNGEGTRINVTFTQN